MTGSRLAAGLATVALLAVAVGGSATSGASIEAGAVEEHRAHVTGLYTGCVHKGELIRVRRNSDTPWGECPDGSYQVSWRRIGVRGPVGPPGPSGPIGPTGAEGDAGPSGEAQLLDTECPAGDYVIGFDAGGIVCGSAAP